MKKARRIIAARGGFSLMEIMMAMAIVVIVIMILMLSDKQKWNILDRGNRYREAIRKIEQKIENKRIGTLATDQLPPNGASTWTTVDGIRMRDSIGSARDVFNNILSNVKSLTVWATWAGSRDTIKITTTIAKDF